MSLLEALVEFLGAFKNAESLSPELRDALTVRTHLEDLLLAAAKDGRTVLITGAAGSGKTHLMTGLRTPKGVQLVGVGGKPKGKHILLVPDATELSIEERITAVKGAKGRVGTIIAINEGPLRETAQASGGKLFRDGAELLHRAQRGCTADFDATLPTVIDMGAFDPVQHNVLTQVLGLSLLREVIAERPCGCTPGSCPRLLAWRQLDNEEVRSRVAKLCGLILLADTDWSFRDIWDFVADLVLGGDCNAGPPTSTWFWRVLYGGSRVSSALRDVCDPDSLALPAIDQRLWYADWNSDQLATAGDVEFQVLSRPDDPANLDKFLWLRSQVLLVSKDASIHDLLYLSLQHRLQRAALEHKLAPIIEAINSYMSYDLLPPASSRLHLWIDHGVEKRTERTHGQILAGTAEASDLNVRASQVVINHPALDQPIFGGRRFLVHDETQAALELTQEKLTLLESRRSFRRADRRHTDLELDLMRFFSRIMSSHLSNELAFLTCDFQRLSGDLHQYAVSKVTNTLEERS